MSDDPRLAELLRRAPEAPAALDAAHRHAVLTAARQTWFRQRARSRRHLIGLALAAGLTAVIAGWTVRSLNDAPLPTTQPIVATAEPPPSKPILRAPAPAITAPPAPAAIAETTAPVVDAARPAEADTLTALAAESGPAERAGRAPQGLVGIVSARTAAAASPLVIPADAPERGRLLVAAAALDAALNQRLADDEREPALRAALAVIAGVQHPAASELRRRIGEQLGRH